MSRAQFFAVGVIGVIALIAYNRSAAIAQHLGMTGMLIPKTNSPII